MSLGRIPRGIPEGPTVREWRPRLATMRDLRANLQTIRDELLTEIEHGRDRRRLLNVAGRLRSVYDQLTLWDRALEGETALVR